MSADRTLSSLICLEPTRPPALALVVVNADAATDPPARSTPAAPAAMTRPAFIDAVLFMAPPVALLFQKPPW
jgi:hypothetical protein